MKKLLILAYDFPPYVSVGGLRPYNWYRYLKEYGVEPIVITRQWSNQYGNQLDYISPGNSNEVIIEKSEFGTIYRTPYYPNLSNRLLLKYGERKFRILRKIISGFYEFSQFLLPIGPRSEIFKTAREFLKINEVDVIIATGDPFILFGYASKLSNDFNTPWIADYRDTWVQDKTRSSNIFIQKWNSYFERRFLKNVATVTTVSSFIIQHLKKNINAPRFEVILNGFNPENIEEGLKTDQLNKTFTISFAGTIYKWHPIDSFIKVCEDFIVKSKDIRFHLNFIGTNDPEGLKNRLENKYKALSNHVSILPKMENENLVKKLAEANSFLLFNDYFILGTKIFTYLGLKRKIILCYENDPKAMLLKQSFYNLEEMEGESNQLQAELIRKTNSGIIVKDSEHLMEVLNDLYAEFESTAQIACHSVGVENYSRKIQVEKLAEIVKSL